MENNNTRVKARSNFWAVGVRPSEMKEQGFPH